MIELNFIETLILVFSFILLAGFIFYKKILNLSLLIVRILFPLSFIGLLITLFIPQLYLGFVESNFEKTTLATNLRSVDNSLTQISKVQNTITNSVNKILNIESANIIDEYQSNIYKEAITLVTNLLRIFFIFVFFVLMIFCLYIRYAFSGLFEYNSLKSELHKLKEEVKLLSKTVNSTNL